MKTLKLILLTALITLALQAKATTYYAVCNCNWTGSSTWSTTANGVGAALPTLVAGDILVISGYTVTVDNQITINPQITINLISNSAAGATLAFQTGNKLTLTSSSSVVNLSNTNSALYPNPKIVPGGGGGNSNLIKIGGNNVWNAGDGTISGVGQLNQGSTNGTLPVTLTSFASTAGDNSIELTWSTASELNFHYFDLQRSADGLTFESIAHIDGHGTTTQAHTYTYTDAFPLAGRNYYRLVSVDFDNATEAFKIIIQEYSAAKEVTLYPNPTNGSNFTISLNFDDTTSSVITIFNNVGDVMATYAVTNYTMELNFSKPLVAGTYVARYTSADLVKNIRFIVQ